MVFGRQHCDYGVTNVHFIYSHDSAVLIQHNPAAAFQIHHNQTCLWAGVHEEYSQQEIWWLWNSGKTNLCLFIHNSRFDKLRQFARVCRSLAEKRHLLWTEHRSRDTTRKKRKKEGQGARTLKRGERTEKQSTTLLYHLRPLCSIWWQPHGKLLLSSHYIK